MWLKCLLPFSFAIFVATIEATVPIHERSGTLIFWRSKIVIEAWKRLDKVHRNAVTAEQKTIGYHRWSKGNLQVWKYGIISGILIGNGDAQSIPYIWRKMMVGAQMKSSVDMIPWYASVVYKLYALSQSNCSWLWTGGAMKFGSFLIQKLEYY